MSDSPSMMSEVTIEDVITNCEDIDLETNADNLRAVYKVMTEKIVNTTFHPKPGNNKLNSLVQTR